MTQSDGSDKDLIVLQALQRKLIRLSEEMDASDTYNQIKENLLKQDVTDEVLYEEYIYDSKSTTVVI